MANIAHLYDENWSNLVDWDLIGFRVNIIPWQGRLCERHALYYYFQIEPINRPTFGCRCLPCLPTDDLCLPLMHLSLCAFCLLSSSLLVGTLQNRFRPFSLAMSRLANWARPICHAIFMPCSWGGQLRRTFLYFLRFFSNSFLLCDFYNSLPPSLAFRLSMAPCVPHCGTHHSLCIAGRFSMCVCTIAGIFIFIHYFGGVTAGRRTVLIPFSHRYVFNRWYGSFISMITSRDMLDDCTSFNFTLIRFSPCQTVRPNIADWFE